MKTQKRLAAYILKSSPKKVRFDSSRLEDIKSAITKADIRSLINEGAIKITLSNAQSRSRARAIQMQKRKGRRKGQGSRKGKQTTRQVPKKNWMSRIRLQRSLLKHLRSKNLIDRKIYQELYKKSKGGFFRSIRHLKLYVNERIK